MATAKSQLEKNQYTKVPHILWDLGYTDCVWEVKVVDSDTYNPNIFEKSQIMGAMSKKITFKLSDIARGIGGTYPGDGVNTSTWLACIIWTKHQTMTIFRPLHAIELIEHSFKYQDLIDHKLVVTVPYKI